MSDITYQGYNKTSLVVFGDRAKYSMIMKTIGGRWNSRLKNFPPGWTVPREREEELKKLIDGFKQHSVVPKKEESSKEESSKDSDQDEDNSEPEPKSRKGQKKYHRAVSASLSQSSGGNHSKSPSLTDIANIISKAEHRSPPTPPPKVSQQSQPSQVPQPSHRSIVDDVMEKKREQARKNFEQEKQAHERSREKISEKPHETKSVESDHSNHYRRHKHHRKPVEQKRRSPERSKKDLKYYESFSKKPERFRALYEPSDDDDRYSSTSDSSTSSSSSDDFPVPDSPKRQTKKHHNTEDYDQLYNKVRDLQKKLYEYELEKRGKKDPKKDKKHHDQKKHKRSR